MSESPVNEPAPNDPGPLDMARNAATAVLRYADAQERDPLRSHLQHFGERGHQSAVLAGNMALVSIAEDLHRIADLLEWESRR